MKQPLNNAILNLVISSDPKLTKLRNYIFRDKNYIDWISFLRFGLQQLILDQRLTEPEKIIVVKARGVIKRFGKVKRPAQYLKSHLPELKPVIEIFLNYE